MGPTILYYQFDIFSLQSCEINTYFSRNVSYNVVNSL